MDNSEVQLARQRESSNAYATNKSISQSLLSTSIFSQIISILIWIWVNDIVNDGLEIALCVFCILSIIFQLFIYTLLSILIAAKSDKIVLKYLKISYLNVSVTYLSGILLLINLTITALYTQLQLQ